MTELMIDWLLWFVYPLYKMGGSEFEREEIEITDQLRFINSREGFV